MTESEKDKAAEEVIEQMLKSFSSAFPSQMLDLDLGELITKSWKEGLTSEEFEKFNSHLRRLKLAGWAASCLHKWRGRESQRRLGLIPTPPLMWVLTFPSDLGDNRPEWREWNQNYMAGPFLTRSEAVEDAKRYQANMQVRPLRQPGEQVFKSILEMDPEPAEVLNPDDPPLIPIHEEELLLKLLKTGQAITQEEAQRLHVHLHRLAALWHTWHARCFHNFHSYRSYRNQLNELEEARGENPDREETDACDPLYVVEIGARNEGDLIGPFDTRDDASQYKESIGAPNLKIYCLRVH